LRDLFQLNFWNGALLPVLGMGLLKNSIVDSGEFFLLELWHYLDLGSLIFKVPEGLHCVHETISAELVEDTLDDSANVRIVVFF
jgi:hypothetical protein